jgi:hypothetical protein
MADSSQESAQVGIFAAIAAAAASCAGVWADTARRRLAITSELEKCITIIEVRAESYVL